MIYYSYELRWKNFDPDKAARMHRTRSSFELNYSESTLESLNDRFYNDFVTKEDVICSITSREEGTLFVYAAAKVAGFDEKVISGILNRTFPDCVIHRYREVTVDEFKRNVGDTNYGNGRKILTKLKIDYRMAGIFDPLPYNWTEQITDLTKLTAAECKRQAEKILASKSFKDELSRIYSRKNAKSYYGHPVHYFISAGDWGGARDMYELLVRALRSNNRLLSNRMSVFRDFRKGAYRDERYRQHMIASEGGIVVLELCSDTGMGRFASDFHEFTKVTGEILEEMKKDTLFIFVEIMGKSVKNADAVGNITAKADIIQITEGSGTSEQARAYLADLTDKSDIKPDSMDEVFEYLPKNESYTVTDIYNAYNNWYGDGLKNHIYKAYKKQDCCRVVITEAEDKPYEELKEMIGLTDAKTTLDRIIAAGKMKCLREQMGLKTEAGSLNMLFAGNPGTAKTTFARLLTQILKEEDVIKSGKLVECGRQDLVGLYVGWTAKIVEEKFREAEGGVLFIDEAYSLVEDSRTYGAEAINTITQLMENYRDKVIVIFAGYPDKMKLFLEQNEGLRSRIAFHLNFPDYTSDELLDILKLHIRKREYALDRDAEAKCLGIFREASGHENYGNGRYVRTFLEQAVIRQSERLVNSVGDKALGKDELCLLLPEDFEAVSLGLTDKEERRMGFAV
ncbi:MAG: AAA family ATPase [Ruminococcus sp.]|nr:AAA family ATPase [Ruminococcus sp.]